VQTNAAVAVRAGLKEQELDDLSEYVLSL
jgi:hypothetical protein